MEHMNVFSSYNNCSDLTSFRVMRKTVLVGESRAGAASAFWLIQLSSL